MNSVSPIPDLSPRAVHGDFLRGASLPFRALGLILPSLLRIRPGLTPLAASGLVALMIGATVLTPILISTEIVLILLPLTVGLLAAFVAYGRWRMAPLHKSSSRRVIRSAS